MYLKQVYQSQNIYKRNKDNFRDIKIAIYDQLSVDSDRSHLHPGEGRLRKCTKRCAQYYVSSNKTFAIFTEKDETLR